MPQPSTVKLSDLNPNPREGETPDQARIRAAGAYAELSNPTPREGETPEDAQKRARGAQAYAEAVNYASAAKAPAPTEAPKQDRGAVEAIGQGVSDVAKTVAGDMSSSELASRQESIARELIPAPTEQEKEQAAKSEFTEEDGAIGLIRKGARAALGLSEAVMGEPPADPATEYERRLAEIAKYGAEAQAELSSGDPIEITMDQMQRLTEAMPWLKLTPIANPQWWATGWPVSTVFPEQQYTDRQWRALYSAYQKASTLPSTLNDPKVSEDSVFSQQDLYNLVVKSGTTSQNTFSAAQAWGQLKDRYVNNHRNANMTPDQLRALEQTAGAWATDALLSTRTFGGILFPVQDLPTFKDEQFKASWSDLIPWPNEEGETWESASSKAVKAQEEIGRVLTPKVEQLPGGAVWQQEGPWDYVFRLEQIPLTVAKEAVTNGTMTPELSDVLRGTQNMESFITEVVEDPDWQRQIQDPSAGVRARAWLTLLAAGGVDVLFPTFIPLVGSATRFSKEIKLATEVYREVLAEAKAGETMASVTEKAAARLAAEAHLWASDEDLMSITVEKAATAIYSETAAGGAAARMTAKEAGELAREVYLRALAEAGFDTTDESVIKRAAAEWAAEVYGEERNGEKAASLAASLAEKMAAMGKAADELEAVRALKAEVAGYRQGFKGKGSELRAAWRESEEALAAKRAETARLAEAAAREEKVRAQTAEAFGDVDEVEDALVTANKIENKSIKADYLARVARNLASDVDVAAFFRKLPELKRILGVPSVIGEVRALGGLSELGKVRDEIGALLEAKRAERAGVEAEYKVIRQRLKDLLKDADSRNVGAERGRLMQEAQPLLQNLQRVRREVLELESSLAGANKYEAGYARASREEARRWSEVMGSGSEAIPSVMRTSGGEAIPVEPTPIPDAPAPVIENVTQAKQVEALLGVEDLDDLKNLKGVGAESREGLADILLDGVEIPKGVSKRTVLERALAFSDEELDVFAAELDDLALQAGGRDPYGALGLPEGENVYDAAAEMVRANLANADLPEEELAEVTQAAKLLPLLLGQNWSRSVSRAANEQQVVRFGSRPADWTYRTAGEWYSLPGAYLVSVPNEMLAPIPKQDMWRQYVERKNYAVRNYIKASTDFATWVGAQGVDGAKALSANIDNLRSVGENEAPTWNAYFRRQVAKYGASESGLTPDHILTGDMVWVPNSPRAAGSLKGVEVPGMVTRYQGSGTRQTVLEVTQTGQTVPRNIPQDFASVQATVQTGFAARVRGVAANGDVELEILTFSAREGAPRPQGTGRVISLSGSELEFMERGRVPAKSNEPLGAMRPKNAAELKQVQGVDGVRYSGDSADYLTGEWTPPIDYTHEDQFRVYMGDLISMYGRKWKSVVRNLGGQTPSAVPIPRILPGEKQAGGGWAAGKAGIRTPEESAAHSVRKGYIKDGEVQEGAVGAALLGEKYNPKDTSFYRSYESAREQFENLPYSREQVRAFAETGEDIPERLVEQVQEALSEISARPYEASEIQDLIWSGGKVELKGGRSVFLSSLFENVAEDQDELDTLWGVRSQLDSDATWSSYTTAAERRRVERHFGVREAGPGTARDIRFDVESTAWADPDSYLLSGGTTVENIKKHYKYTYIEVWKSAVDRVSDDDLITLTPAELSARFMPLLRDELKAERARNPELAKLVTDADIDQIRTRAEFYVPKQAERAERQRIGAEHLKRKEAADKAREQKGRLSLLPGEKEPGGGWAEGKTGVRTEYEAIRNSIRRGYIDPETNTVRPGAAAAAYMGWNMNPKYQDFYEDFEKVLTSMRNPSSTLGKHLTFSDLLRYENTGDDIPDSVLKEATKAINKIAARKYDTSEVRDIIYSGGAVKVPLRGGREAMFLSLVRKTDRDPKDALSIKEYKRILESETFLSQGFGLLPPRPPPDWGPERLPVWQNREPLQNVVYEGMYKLVIPFLDQKQKDIFEFRHAKNPNKIDFFRLQAKATDKIIDSIELLPPDDYRLHQGFIDSQDLLRRLMPEMRNLLREERTSTTSEILKARLTDEFIDNFTVPMESVPRKRAERAERQRIGAEHLKRKEAAAKAREARRAAQAQDIKLATEAGDIEAQKRVADAISSEITKSSEIGKKAMLDVVEAHVTGGKLSEDQGLALSLIIERLPEKVARNIVLQVFDDVGGAPAGFTNVKYKTSMKSGRLVTLVGLGVPSPGKALEVGVILAHEFTHAMMPHLPEELLAELRQAYARHKKNQAKSLLSRFLKPRYKDDSERFEEWLAWVVSDYVTRKKLPEQAANIASKAKGDSKKKWDTLERVFNSVRDATKNFLGRIIKGDIGETDKSVRQFVNDWYSADPKVRAQFNDKLVNFYGDLKRSQEEEISAAYKARVEANAAKREAEFQAKKKEMWEDMEKQGLKYEERVRRSNAWEKKMAAAREREATTKAERLRIQAEDDLAQEGKLQSLLIDQARRKRFRGLVDESKAANPEMSAYEHEMRAYLQVVREELKAAGQAAKEALKGTDLRHAQQDYAQAREAIMAAKDLRRKILTLLKEDVQPRLEEQLTGLKSYAAERKAFRAENLKVPERPSMYRPPLTPVESQVADRVASEMGRVGSYAQAPMTNTLLSRLAEGWAVHHGNAAQTADHALVKLLKYQFPHKATFSDVATFMLRELGLEVNADELITALRQMDAKAAGLLPAEVDHFADLQRLAREAKVEGSVDQQKVNEVLTLLQEQAWKSRSETVRMPGRHSLERTMQGLQAKEEFYRKASLKGVPSAVRRFEGFIKAYLTPARDHMDASMRKGLKDLARSFDVRSNKVNELLVAVARKNPQPNDLIRAIENELPGAQKAWFDSSQGGTMSSELFDELLKSYFNPANVTPNAENLASLRRIVIDGTRSRRALTEIADELYEATMKFVRAANAEHKVEAEIARVQGDAAFAKIFATQVLFHQSIRDSLGLGAVVDASSMAKIVSWSTSDYRSASGLDFIQNVIENPLKYQSALDLDLADTVTLGLWSKLTGPERGGVSKAEDLEQLAQAHARVFSEPSLEAAKSKADQVVTKAKPFLTKAALRHYNAQINEALDVSKGAARLDMSVYKQLLTVGLLDASAGVVHHLGNTFGDTARIASELGFRQAWNSLRDSLPSHIILTPFFTSASVLAKNLPLPEALKAIKTQMGDTKFGQWFGNVMSYISRHPDVHVILEGDLTKVYKDAKGREWTHAEILEMAQRYGVPESFALDQIKRVVDDYLKKVANNRGQVPTRLRNAITLLSDVPRDAAAYLGQQRRMALALSLLDDGYDLEKAMSTASRVLLDYKHDLHPVDRMILVNLLLPFWSFSKTNAAAVARLALTPSAWDGATIRYERSLEKGTQILSQYLTHDGRDEYGMCDVDMPPEQYQKWVKFRDSLRERGVSYDEFVHMINFGARGGKLEAIKIQNKPVPEPTVWMAVEAKKFGFEQGEWDVFVLEYFVPDPSRASLPSHFQERAAVFWNIGRGEAAKKIASQVGNDAYATIPTPASPNRDAVNLFASTAVVGVGSFAVTLDFLDSTIQSLQTPGWENDPDVVAQVSLLEQNKRMVEENLQRVLGDPERNAFVNATGSFVGMRPNYPAAPVSEDLAAVLPETWIQARQENVDGEYITTYSVKPEYSAIMDTLLATGAVTAIPSLIRFINPKHDRFLRDPANTGGDMFSFAAQVLPYLGLKPHTVSASRNLRQAEYDAAKLTEERMQFAGSNPKAPNLTPAQIGAMERERGDALVRRMSLDVRKIVARRIVDATSSPGKHEYEMPISPIGRALLVMDYGLPPEEVDQMSNEEVFARLATLTGK